MKNQESWLENRILREAVDEEAERKIAIARAKEKCEVCGVKIELDRHHIVTRIQGAGDYRLHKAQNLLMVCRLCHIKIHERRTGFEKYLKRDFDF